MSKVQEKHMEDFSKYEEIIDKCDEVKEALETMRRIVAVEDVKARHIYLIPQRYFQIR